MAARYANPFALRRLSSSSPRRLSLYEFALLILVINTLHSGQAVVSYHHSSCFQDGSVFLVAVRRRSSNHVISRFPDASTTFRRRRRRNNDHNIVDTFLPLLFCQLLGINSKEPTSFQLAWPDFCERGGGSDIHRDGWGLSYYSGHGLRQFHDVEPASTSALAAFLGQQKIKTRNLLGHIRYATAGSVDLVNVHPFAREMWAQNFCFCHNGEVPLFIDHPDYQLGGVSGERIYYPVGSTDSEATFCAILNALRSEFQETMPSLPSLYEKLQSLCQEIVDYNKSETILNFLLTCGPHVLWVYSWPGARPGSTVWNGLHYSVSKGESHLQDEDLSVEVSAQDTVCIVATAPLSDDEAWVELEPGELLVLDNGIPHTTVPELFRVELQGHGLRNDGKALKPARLEEDMRRYQFEPEFFAAGGI